MLIGCLFIAKRLKRKLQPCQGKKQIKSWKSRKEIEKLIETKLSSAGSEQLVRANNHPSLQREYLRFAIMQ